MTVLDQQIADSVIDGDVDVVETWLQSLDRPEDINSVDEQGNTVLNLLAHGFHTGESHNLRGMRTTSWGGTRAGGGPGACCRSPKPVPLAVSRIWPRI